MRILPEFIIYICVAISSFACYAVKDNSETTAITVTQDKSAKSAIKPNMASIELARMFVNMNNIKADFIQKTKDNSKSKKVERGLFVFKKPGFFQWQVKSPYKQEIYINADKTIVVEPDFKQAIVHTTNTDSLHFNLFAGDANKIAQQYNVTMNTKGKRVIYNVMPKEKNDLFSYIYITFQADKLTTIEWEDALGKTIILEITNLIINSKLDNSIFTADITKLLKNGYDIADYQTQK